MTRPVSPLICPVCSLDLFQVEKTLKCSRGHSFDLARAGYVNLRPAGRRLKIAGDTKEMVRARRTFLNRGHYAPLSKAVNTLVRQYLTRPDNPTGQIVSDRTIYLVDSGCGEGYYLGQLQDTLRPYQKERQFLYFGMDISKEAVRAAATQYKTITFFVADVNDKLLFPDQTIGVLINIFAPRNAAEFGRIIAPGGLLLVVIPNQAHLETLRNELALLNIAADKQQQLVTQLAYNFKLVKTETIQYTIALGQDDLSQLVRMTPNHWHLSEPAQLKLAHMTAFETTASFKILLFQRAR